jgi:hypothetical protein
MTATPETTRGKRVRETLRLNTDLSQLTEIAKPLLVKLEADRDGAEPEASPH